MYMLNRYKGVKSPVLSMNTISIHFIVALTKVLESAGSLKKEINEVYYYVNISLPFLLNSTVNYFTQRE